MQRNMRRGVTLYASEMENACFREPLANGSGGSGKKVYK
jgi:hypothetical protein